MFVGGSSVDFEGDSSRTEVDDGCQLLKKCTVQNRAQDCWRALLKEPLSTFRKLLVWF